MGFHQSEGSRVASILLASLLKISVDLTKFSQHAAACRKKTGSKGADGRAHMFLNNNHIILVAVHTIVHTLCLFSSFTEARPFLSWILISQNGSSSSCLRGMLQHKVFAQ